MRAFLFDIDGTLIDSGGASRNSLNKVFQDRFSIQNAFDSIIMAGKTDIQIIREGLSVHRIAGEEGTIPCIVQDYVERLACEIHNDAKHTQPGVVEFLNALRTTNVCVLGLLTGNIERGAHIKLEVFGLNGYFSAGAFGDDNEDRRGLLPVAVDRLRKIARVPIRFSECTVVGDTPEDVRCAKPFGARSIAVSTGRYDRAALSAAGGDHVFGDMNEALRCLDDLMK